MVGQLLVLAGLLALALAQGPEPWYQCDSLLPIGQAETDQQYTFSPFAVFTHGTSVERGKTFRVTLKCLQTEGQIESYTSFVIQAHYINRPRTAIGFWEFDEDVPAVAQHCNGGTEGSNTLSSNETSDKCNIDVLWRAPEDLMGDVEFIATFQNKDGQFWKVNSIEVRLTVADGDASPIDVKPPIVSGDSLHQAIKEVELAKQFVQKQVQEIQDEDKYSEGDWQRKEEEERRKHEEEMRWEMEQFEKAKADEDRARQERMHQEMLDKEEYDRQAWENEHKPETSGGQKHDEQDENLVQVDDEEDFSDKDGVRAKTTSGAGSALSGFLLPLLLAFFLFRH